MNKMAKLVGVLFASMLMVIATVVPANAWSNNWTTNIGTQAGFSLEWNTTWIDSPGSGLTHTGVQFRIASGCSRMEGGGSQALRIKYLKYGTTEGSGNLYNSGEFITSCNGGKGTYVRANSVSWVTISGVVRVNNSPDGHFCVRVRVQDGGNYYDIYKNQFSWDPYTTTTC